MGSLTSICWALSIQTAGEPIAAATPDPEPAPIARRAAPPEPIRFDRTRLWDEPQARDEPAAAVAPNRPARPRAFAMGHSQEPTDENGAQNATAPQANAPLDDALARRLRAKKPDAFLTELGRGFWERFQLVDDIQFQIALQRAWTLPPISVDPLRDRPRLRPVDYAYNNALLERRARSPITGLANDALGETQILDRLKREFDGETGLFGQGARTLLGDSTSARDPLDLGDLGLRGFPRAWRNPGDLVGITYETGPLDVRIGGATTNAKVQQKLGPWRLQAGATLDYEESSVRARLQLQRSLGRLSTLSLVFGSGVDLFLVPGNLPFLEDPRERPDVGIMALWVVQF
ncbi:MAG: hypothetical protein JNJ88_19355 [Planctomycetes bacterium]|nr:hypothetical protein [Planctomycetota bacterium]